MCEKDANLEPPGRDALVSAGALELTVTTTVAVACCRGLKLAAPHRRAIER
jgi:hypothetical protein